MAVGTILTTRRLRVRNWRETDVDAYHTHCNTDSVMQYLGGTDTKRAVRREVLWYQRHQAQHGHTFWVVVRKSDNALLGFAGLIRLAENDSPLEGKLEIGWRLREDMWRRGYGYEAAAAVIDWAEWELGGETLYARIHRDNVASQALARKLGLRRARAMEAKQRKLSPELYVYRARL